MRECGPGRPRAPRCPMWTPRLDHRAESELLASCWTRTNSGQAREVPSDQVTNINVGRRSEMSFRVVGLRAATTPHCRRGHPMTLLYISTWLMLFFGGLWAGGILIFAVERTNLWRRMPIDQYSVDFRRSLFRVDPMMPILSVITGIASVAFALLQDGGVARILAWAGIGLVLVVIITSVAIGEPINSKFRGLPEGQVPEDAAHYRDLWRNFHVGRTFAALASFGCLAAAAAA